MIEKTRFDALKELEIDSNPDTTSLPLFEDLNDDAAYGGEMEMYKGYFVIPNLPRVFHSKAEVDEYLKLKELEENK